MGRPWDNDRDNHNMGVSINGGTPIAGWLKNGKIPSQMDEDWGYRKILGKLHIVISPTLSHGLPTSHLVGNLNTKRPLMEYE